jgi:hypothetical protein
MYQPFVYITTNYTIVCLYLIQLGNQNYLFAFISYKLAFMRFTNFILQN